MSRIKTLQEIKSDLDFVLEDLSKILVTSKFKVPGTTSKLSLIINELTQSQIKFESIVNEEVQ